MDRQATRTDLYSEHLERIKELRKKALDARTMAREYKDLAEEISKIRTRGAYWDIAQKEVVDRSLRNSQKFLDLSISFGNEADILETTGFK